jgi:hypothetical protein
MFTGTLGILPGQIGQGRRLYIFLLSDGPFIDSRKTIQNLLCTENYL